MASPGSSGIRHLTTLVSVLVLVVLAAGCSASTAAPAPAPTSTASSGPSTPTAPPTPREQAIHAAMRVYNAHWEALMQAQSAPRARDWEPIISRYMADPIRHRSLHFLRGLAALPAHRVGRPHRSPWVKSVSLDKPHTVVIRDCIDITDTDLVDKAGKSIVDPDQPLRYVFQAEVVLYQNPQRWLVQETTLPGITC